MLLWGHNNLNLVYLLPVFAQVCCILESFPTARATDGDIEMLPDVGQDTFKIWVPESAQAT